MSEKVSMSNDPMKFFDEILLSTIFGRIDWSKLFEILEKFTEENDLFKILFDLIAPKISFDENFSLKNFFFLVEEFLKKIGRKENLDFLRLKSFDRRDLLIVVFERLNEAFFVLDRIRRGWGSGKR